MGQCWNLCSIQRALPMPSRRYAFRPIRGCSMNPPDIQLGVYRHFKGGLYEVIGIAQQTDSNQWFVIYRPLHEQGRLYARPASEFTQSVTRDGRTVPRFQLSESTSSFEVLMPS